MVLFFLDPRRCNASKFYSQEFAAIKNHHFRENLGTSHLNILGVVLSVNGLYIRFIVKVKLIVIISVSGLYQLGFNYRREREKELMFTGNLLL